MERHRTPAPDPRLLNLRRGLIPLEGPPPLQSPGADDRIQAAVSIVIRSEADMQILLIRRAESEGDPWSGHMALPGGRRDPSDRDLLQTATRETLEETGVYLDNDGVLLGRMDPLVPATIRLPPISIVPFVFGVPGGTSARAASPEVDQIFWTPLSLLWSPEASGTVDIQLGDMARAFPCLRAGENVVWGLTYRILRNLEFLF